MEKITFQTNEQLWKIENAAASAGYKKTNDCYWAQIFRNEETGHEFSTSREENSTNDPAADLVAMLTPSEEIPAEEAADPAAEVFPELVKAVNAEAELRKDGKRFYIENGFCRTWAAEHRTDPDRGLKEWSTPKKWEAYQAGTLPREKAVEIAQKRAAADVEKWREQQLSKLRTAAAAPALSFLSVSVEWKRSSTWGHNPTATARTDDGTFSGYASGCGYDKESAAVGEALNESPAVMRVLYQAAEQAMKNGESFKTLSSGCVSWGDVLGYGSGYAILPYFEGGVGVSCFWSILQKCGFVCRCSGSGRWFDTYTAERKGA